MVWLIRYSNLKRGSDIMSDPLIIKKELLFNEYTWHEDGNCLEWVDGRLSNSDDHHRIPCNLEDAFEIAKKQKAVLVIQPEFQEQCIFADFTCEEIDENGD